VGHCFGYSGLAVDAATDSRNEKSEAESDNPKFLAILERTRMRLREEGGIPYLEMRRRLGLTN
jgi:hypothetical protein